MKFTLSKDNIKKAEEKFSTNEHFKHIALPRLMAVYAVKKTLCNIPELKWSFEYNFTNINTNRIILEYQHPKSADLNLFYEIPLTQKFEMRAFLGISSAHFLDIYNFLIKENIIKENQFTLKAEYHTIPHFILNKTQRYNTGILNSIELSSSLEKYVDKNIQQEIKTGIELFLPIFKTITEHFSYH